MIQISVTSAGFPDDFSESFRRILQGVTPDFSRSFGSLVDPRIFAEVAKPVQEASLRATEELAETMQKYVSSALPDPQQWLASLTPTLDLFASVIEHQASEIDEGLHLALRELDEHLDEEWLERLADNEPEDSKRVIDKLSGRFWRAYIWRDEQFAKYSDKALRGLQILHWAIYVEALKAAIRTALIMAGQEDLASLFAPVAGAAIQEATSPSRASKVERALLRSCPFCAQLPGNQCVTVSGKSPGTPTSTHSARMD